MGTKDEWLEEAQVSETNKTDVGEMITCMELYKLAHTHSTYETMATHKMRLEHILIKQGRFEKILRSLHIRMISY